MDEHGLVMFRTVNSSGMLAADDTSLWKQESHYSEVKGRQKKERKKLIKKEGVRKCKPRRQV